ncbi:MAG: TIGR03915 family putative DNA repair protein [Synergistaceae bacterium]|jgi:probable DNA metabolism protein|nr:TIGR03915 family putative DNA repair protein [Synergistaceae bacterium]
MIYVYDGTWDGLMCLVHRTARDQSVPEGIVRRYGEGDTRQARQEILFKTTIIENDAKVAEATAAVLKKRVSRQLLSDAWFALLSCDRGDDRHFSSSVDMALWHTLERVWTLGKRAEADLSDEYAHVVRKAALRTGGEYNKYLGVVRFKDVGGIFYAELEPDCDVLALLADHFGARLPDRGWVLHDLRRKKAAVYDTKKWIVTDMDLPRAPSDTKEEREIQELWREFYRSTTTGQRLNYKTQRGHMPKKYWKHLVETPGSLSGHRVNENHNPLL